MLWLFASIRNAAISSARAADGSRHFAPLSATRDILRCNRIAAIARHRAWPSGTTGITWSV